MKNLILLSVLTASLVVPALSLAAATSTSNGDPNLAVQAWGLNGYQTPKVLCFTGSHRAGDMCQDISATPYYLARLNPVGITWLTQSAFGGFTFN